jgi:Leucine-rich repeat (LRR) protein
VEERFFFSGLLNRTMFAKRAKREASSNNNKNGMSETDDTAPLKSKRFKAELDLPGIKLSAFPEYVSTLTNLNVLNIGHNQLSTFPEYVTTFTHLKVLDLSHSQVSAFPSSISTLTT